MLEGVDAELDATERSNAEEYWGEANWLAIETNLPSFVGFSWC